MWGNILKFLKVHYVDTKKSVRNAEKNEFITHKLINFYKSDDYKKLTPKTKVLNFAIKEKELDNLTMPSIIATDLKVPLAKPKQKNKLSKENEYYKKLLDKTYEEEFAKLSKSIEKKAMKKALKKLLKEMNKKNS